MPKGSSSLEPRTGRTGVMVNPECYEQENTLFFFFSHFVLRGCHFLVFFLCATNSKREFDKHSKVYVFADNRDTLRPLGVFVLYVTDSYCVRRET